MNTLTNSSYDVVLAKDTFVAKLKESGVPEEEIAQEWNKVKKHFEIACVQVAYEKLSLQDQKELRGSLDIQNPSDVQTFFERIQQFVQAHPFDENTREELLKAAVTTAYQSYGATMEDTQHG